MPKFVTFFNFHPHALTALMANPHDRIPALRRVVEAAGGTLESYYWMHGQYDGLAIVEVPSALKAAALSLGVSSTDLFTHYETHELIEPEQLVSLIRDAKTVRDAYVLPGPVAAGR